MKKNVFLISLLAMTLFWSCKEDEVIDQAPSNFSSNVLKEGSADGEIELGLKKEDPNSLKNMLIALKSIQKDDARFNEIVIEPNFKYVRVEPTTEEAQWLLNGNEKLHLFNFPMDYELKKGGSSFKDPEKKNEFQAYWVVVPIDYQFSEGIEVKVLDELFIPFGTGNFSITPTEKFVKIYKEIEMRSNELIDSSKPSKKAKVAFTDYGTIRVEDDILSGIKGSQIFLPIQGVKIRAKRNSITSETTTDANGNFTVPYNFAGNIDSYSIVWQNTEFDLLDGNTSLAITTRLNHTTPWIPQITKAVSPKEFRFSHVFRGAYNYYYRVPLTHQIEAPPNTYSLGLSGYIKMRIAVKDGNSSHYFGTNTAFNPASVVIENNASSSNPIFESRYLFSQVTHELTHAKHWKYGMTDVQYCFNISRSTLAESYAMGCENEIVNYVYSQLASPSSYVSFDRRLLQNQQNSYWASVADSPCAIFGNNKQRVYTPIFIDLIDSTNQYVYWQNQNGTGYLYPNDNFGGFNIKFLEDRLKLHPLDWDGFKNKVKTDNPLTNVSAQQIEYLFNLYKN